MSWYLAQGLPCTLPRTASSHLSLSANSVLLISYLCDIWMHCANSIGICFKKTNIVVLAELPKIIKTLLHPYMLYERKQSLSFLLHPNYMLSFSLDPSFTPRICVCPRFSHEQRHLFFLLPYSILSPSPLHWAPTPPWSTISTSTSCCISVVRIWIPPLVSCLETPHWVRCSSVPSTLQQMTFLSLKLNKASLCTAPHFLAGLLLMNIPDSSASLVPSTRQR